jgi:outer membrane protein TolC
MKKWFTVLLLMWGFGSTGQKTLSLEEALAIALQYNYDIRLSKNDSLIYNLNNELAYAAFLPSINASAAVVFNNNDARQKLSDGTVREQTGVKSDNLQAAINLNWTLFDGLKMFITRNKLREMTELGDLTIKNTVLNTISNVITAYYEIVRLKQQLRAIEEQMGINEERVIQAEKKLSVGLSAKPELLQAKTDLNAQKAARLNQMNLIAQSKEILNEWMAVAPGTDYNVTDSIPLNTSLIAGDIFAGAETSNPEILLTNKQISIAEYSLKERKADRFPTVHFNAAYNFNRTNNHTVLNTFTPLLNRNRGFNYGFSTSIPLFNGYNVKRQIKEAGIEVEYRKLLKDYTVARIRADISRAYKNYELQKQTLQLEEENILLAKENVAIAMERYKLGLSTSLELRETQKSLEESFTRLINARYNTKIAETDLLRLSGLLLK